MHNLAASFGLLASLSLLAVPQSHAQRGPLTIWIASDRADGGLLKVGERFTRATGVKVVVERSDDPAGRFPRAAADRKLPDIILWGHDRVGEWVRTGNVEPINPKPKLVGMFDKAGWDALTFRGAVYGYPISIDAIGLVYNKAMVRTPPRTFEELFALDKELTKSGKHAILWNYANPHLTFPLLAAGGGYPFGRDAKGDFVATDVGVNNAGAVRGAELLAKLVAAGVMPKGVTTAGAEAAMSSGAVAMTLAGPSTWASLRRSRIDFGVAPLPSHQGKPARAFINVLGAMIHRASTQKALAVEFLESYLLTLEGLRTLDSDLPPGVPAQKEHYKSRAGDPLVAGTMANVRNGLLLPGMPELGKFVTAMGPALSAIAEGRQAPKEALDTAASRIR